MEMNHIATRAFSTLSLALYLGLFAFVAKVSFNSSTSISFSVPSLEIFSPRPPQMDWMHAMIPVEIKKEELKEVTNFKITEVHDLKYTKLAPKNAPVALAAPSKLPAAKAVMVAKKVENFNWRQVAGEKNLPKETIHNYLTTVEFQASRQEFLALYKDIGAPAKTEVAAVSRAPAEKLAPVVEDVVKTTMASAAGVDPLIEDDVVLYDYKDEKDAPAKVTKTEQAAARVQQEELAPKTQSTQKIIDNRKSEDKVEEVSVGDLLAFDYSNAAVTAPKVSAAPAPVVKKVSKASSQSAVTTQTSEALTENPDTRKAKKQSSLQSVSSVYVSGVSIYTNSIQDLTKFEIQFKDDASDYSQDTNGIVRLDVDLNDPVNTRSVRLVAKDHVTTHTDLTLDQNSPEHTVPAMSNDYFFTMQEGNQQNGALLVKVEGEIEDVNIDKKYSKKTYLDSKLNETKDSDFAFIQFSNVQLGNTVVSFKTNLKEVKKIVHIHEAELTYEEGRLEDLSIVSVDLFEDNLLSQEKIPLNINAEDMTEFAQELHVEKLALNTYKLPIGQNVWGNRLYVELIHLKESIFVGIGSNKNVSLPSEDYLSLVLSRFPQGQLGNRCMVQVNLTKKALSVVHDTEAVEKNLYTQVQMFDKDGRFHDSISEKTEKIFIQGEYQGNSDYDPNGFVHMKINYVDGTNDYLKTVCSPNSYLVEQL